MLVTSSLWLPFHECALQFSYIIVKAQVACILLSSRELSTVRISFVVEVTYPSYVANVITVWVRKVWNRCDWRSKLLHASTVAIQTVSLISCSSQSVKSDFIKIYALPLSTQKKKCPPTLYASFRVNQQPVKQVLTMKTNLFSVLVNDISSCLETHSVLCSPENKIWHQIWICESKDRNFTQVLNCC